MNRLLFVAALSNDELFGLAARYGDELNAAKRRPDAEKEKRTREKRADVIAELERRGAIKEIEKRSVG